MSEKDIKRLCVGLVAHVDAGKTTLAEAMLYLSGKLRKLGRVDHRDCFLDTHELEREKGITIFSKQARTHFGDTEVTLLDTPGHADFSAEAERSLQVMDAAVLVISGTDGVQPHTETLWTMLRRSGVPCFIFVSKMDIPGKSPSELMCELRGRLSEACVDFTDSANIDEAVAMLDEEALEEYSDTGSVRAETKAELISERRLFPVLFGSGLKLKGVDELMSAINTYLITEPDNGEFSARVFKISRDSSGARLTHLKVCSGELSVRSALAYRNEKGEPFEEKVSQLRLYSGSKFDPAEKVGKGQIAAVLGLSETFPGQGLGTLGSGTQPISESVLSYALTLPPSVDARALAMKLRQLQEEDPQLRITWNEQYKNISVQLVGSVQKEVLRSIIKERFDVDVGFDEGHILYKETISDTVEGVGHFEPLRHYAEVHLVLEPLPQGSGLRFETVCSEDELDRNWQRLILTHLSEKQHRGVLTGAPITDMKITLAAGKAHIKHTEGGDFRQATYRAVRQGLMQAKSVLLEPWYAFTLSVPPETLGRAMSDIKTMGGETESPETVGQLIEITGCAPVRELNNYMESVAAYTRGRGRMSIRPGGYRPCRNSVEIIEKTDYDPLADLENTPDSVFCAHGSGVNIPWSEVKSYMHLPSCLAKPSRAEESEIRAHRLFTIDERELEAIMEREFGPIKRPEYAYRAGTDLRQSRAIPARSEKNCVIVDGYNLIFSWPELKKLAADDMDLARTRLTDILSNYAGFTSSELILVFDGYRNTGSPGSKGKHCNIRVAYTAEGETGDAYIERIANDIGKNYSVRVVTSDNLIRLSALRSGVLRTSSKEFQAEVENVLSELERLLERTNDRAHLMRLRDGKQ